MDKATEMEAIARATLSVCESLVIAMAESGVLSRADMLEMLADARHAHWSLAAEHAGEAPEQREIHERAATMIAQVMEGVRASAPLV